MNRYRCTCRERSLVSSVTSHSEREVADRNPVLDDLPVGAAIRHGDIADRSDRGRASAVLRHRGSKAAASSSQRTWSSWSTRLQNLPLEDRTERAAPPTTSVATIDAAAASRRRRRDGAPDRISGLHHVAMAAAGGDHLAADLPAQPRHQRFDGIVVRLAVLLIDVFRDLELRDDTALVVREVAQRAGTRAASGRSPARRAAREAGGCRCAGHQRRVPACCGRRPGGAARRSSPPAPPCGTAWSGNRRRRHRSPRPAAARRSVPSTPGSGSGCPRTGAAAAPTARQASGGSGRGRWHRSPRCCHGTRRPRRRWRPRPHSRCRPAPRRRRRRSPSSSTTRMRISAPSP